VCLTVFVCLSQCVCISQCVILFLSVDVSLSLSVCFHCLIIRDLIKVIPECSSGFPYLIQLSLNFAIRS